MVADGNPTDSFVISGHWRVFVDFCVYYLQVAGLNNQECPCIVEGDMEENHTDPCYSMKYH